MNETKLRSAYIDEVEYVEKITAETQPMESSASLLGVSTYKHFKNDFINEAKEHISKINQLLSK